MSVFYISNYTNYLCNNALPERYLDITALIIIYLILASFILKILHLDLHSIFHNFLIYG